MRHKFSDITLYNPSSYNPGSPEQQEEVSISNFVSDLYVQYMNGYNPPKTTRITIQPAYHTMWNKSHRVGSVISIAPYFNHKEFSALDIKGRYKYILDIIQSATTALVKEYGWQKSVFEKAYQQVLENDFKFKIEYEPKKSGDRKKTGAVIIEKTEKTTRIFAKITTPDDIITRLLIEKPNSFWYDCAYTLAQQSKWFDNDRFGIKHNRGKIQLWYSLERDEVQIFDAGHQVTTIDFKKYFLFG